MKDFKLKAKMLETEKASMKELTLSIVAVVVDEDDDDYDNDDDDDQLLIKNRDYKLLMHFN